MTESWLIIHTPDGVHCWPLAAGDHEPQIVAARAAVGFPADDGWIAEARWDAQVTHGEPHPRLLARATVHAAGDLAAVDVTSYAEQLGQARETARQAEARARWDALPEAERADVLAQLTAPAAPTKGGTR